MSLHLAQLPVRGSNRSDRWQTSQRSGKDSALILHPAIVGVYTKRIFYTKSNHRRLVQFSSEIKLSIRWQRKCKVGATRWVARAKTNQHLWSERVMTNQY